MRTELIDRTRTALGQAGYALSEPSALRSASFDLVARRSDQVLLVKVFSNVDSLGEAVARELRVLCGLLRAAPLLVGERASAGPLEDSVVYVRHGVPLVTPGTLEQFVLEGVPPLVYAAPGGFYVNLDGPRLRDLRAERNLSLGQLAEAAGVSRRAIAMYEEGMGALVDVAERLEQFLEEALVQPVALFQPPRESEPPQYDPAAPREALERAVLQHLQALGYRVVPTGRSPFNAVSQEQRRDELILTGVGEMDADLGERAKALRSIGSIVEREVVVFVRDRKQREHVEGAALITQGELERMDETADVLDLIRRRARAGEG
ncbi:MAG: transcriptional regulator [Halobacteriales archaeon]|nr:transcriptional regulator [Halobacteriales archaeon]